MAPVRAARRAVPGDDRSVAVPPHDRIVTANSRKLTPVQSTKGRDPIMNIRKLFATSAFAIASVIVNTTMPAGATPGNTQIDGVAKIDFATCTELASPLTLRMTGSLEGCWYTTSLEVVHTTPSGGYRERGTERFIGCLTTGGSNKCGSFDTIYQFEAKYQTSPPFAEIHGRCQHPIVSGTGDFEGVTGRVDFKDDVQNGCFYYRGHIAFK